MGKRMPEKQGLTLVVVVAIWLATPAEAADLNLQELIDEALQNSPEILAAKARSAAAGHRVPQARSLPDPMLMTGYQNEGLTATPTGTHRRPVDVRRLSNVPVGGQAGAQGRHGKRRSGQPRGRGRCHG